MFLTLEDPRAKIKGSRDPLGVQPVWSAFGRHVVTNLTTVTRVVRGFTVVLLGRHWVARLIAAGRIREEDALDVFLRCEQVAAYARHVVHEADGILGIERVARNARDGGGKLVIDPGPAGRILSDQKTYGLWGLYTVSSRVSGLVDSAGRLTAAAEEHLERVALPHVHDERGRIDELLVKGGQVRARRDDKLLAAFGACLDPALNDDEHAFYAEYLRDGAHVTEFGEPGRQARMRELLEDHAVLEAPLGREELERVLQAAERVDEGLAHRLDRILAVEALLAPAEVLFGHIQARNGQRPAELAQRLRNRWGARVPHLPAGGFDVLRAEVEAHTGPEQTAAMARAHAALGDGDYQAAIEALLDWNRVVMSERSAAPWVQLGDDGRIDVRYRSAEPVLPDGDELPTLWKNPYFVGTLKEITLSLAEDRQ